MEIATAQVGRNATAATVGKRLSLVGKKAGRCIESMCFYGLEASASVAVHFCTALILCTLRNARLDRQGNQRIFICIFLVGLWEQAHLNMALFTLGPRPREHRWEKSWLQKSCYFSVVKIHAVCSE